MQPTRQRAADAGDLSQSSRLAFWAAWKKGSSASRLADLKAFASACPWSSFKQPKATRNP